MSADILSDVYGFIANRALPSREVRTAAALRLHMHQLGASQCELTCPQIMHLAGLPSSASASFALRDLERAGVLTVTRRRQKPSIIRFVDDAAETATAA